LRKKEHQKVYSKRIFYTMISKRVISIALSNRHSYVKDVCKISCHVRQYASKKEGGFFSKMVNKVTGSKKAEESELVQEAMEGTDSREYEAYKADLEEFEKEEEEKRKQEVEKARLKSRLFHSDRAILHNQMPQAGIDWEKNDDHRSNSFKSAMLARYGNKTGIDPSVAWPTKEYIEEQNEYESVLYDGKTLKEMIEFVEKTEREKEEEAQKIEKNIREKLAKQQEEIKAWQKRVETRNVVADRERLKRQQILDELREEYGYEINPNDPQFASRIEEKEKEISKLKKKENLMRKKAAQEAYEAKQRAEREERIDSLKEQSTQEKEAS